MGLHQIRVLAVRGLRPHAPNLRGIVSHAWVLGRHSHANSIILVADTRTVTRTQPPPHTRDHHSPGLVGVRPGMTGSGAETVGTTGRSQAGARTARSRGETRSRERIIIHQFYCLVRSHLRRKLLHLKLRTWVTTDP